VDGELGGRRVAIACEGGGSHTAFTAGVLRRLLREPIEIVALSGTSGGAVCATLAWRGLLAGDRDDAVRRLEAFWDDNASEGLEALWEGWFRLSARLVGEVVSPELSPYSYAWDAREPFRQLLERHCGFGELPGLLGENRAAPRLLTGATDVRSGEFAVFRSHPVTHRGETYPAVEITADVILASAAVPTLFRAVEIDGRYYWDGVFAQNPPLRELPDMARTLPGGEPPDEIWLVRINPKTRSVVPRSMAEIRDRRNELVGIISLEQELYLIDLLNRLVAAGELTGTKHKPITLPGSAWVTTSPAGWTTSPCSSAANRSSTSSSATAGSRRTTSCANPTATSSPKAPSRGRRGARRRAPAKTAINGHRGGAARETTAERARARSRDEARLPDARAPRTNCVA
jgi:NTE family protein